MGIGIGSTPVGDRIARDCGREDSVARIITANNAGAGSSTGFVTGLASLGARITHHCVAALRGGEGSSNGSLAEVSISDTSRSSIPGTIGLALGRGAQVVTSFTDGSTSLAQGSVVGATTDKVQTSDLGAVVDNQSTSRLGTPDTSGSGGTSNALAKGTRCGLITGVTDRVQRSIDNGGGEAGTVLDEQFGTESSNLAAFGCRLEGLVCTASSSGSIELVTKPASQSTTFLSHSASGTALSHRELSDQGTTMIRLGCTDGLSTPARSFTSGSGKRLITLLAGNLAGSTNVISGTRRSSICLAGLCKTEVRDQLTLRSSVPSSVSLALSRGG